MNKQRINKHLQTQTLVLATLAGIFLAGCGGGSPDQAENVRLEFEKTLPEFLLVEEFERDESSIPLKEQLEYGDETAYVEYAGTLSFAEDLFFSDDESVTDSQGNVFYVLKKTYSKGQKVQCELSAEFRLVDDEYVFENIGGRMPPPEMYDPRYKRDISSGPDDRTVDPIDGLSIGRGETFYLEVIGTPLAEYNPERYVAKGSDKYKALVAAAQNEMKSLLSDSPTFEGFAMSENGRNSFNFSLKIDDFNATENSFSGTMTWPEYGGGGYSYGVAGTIVGPNLQFKASGEVKTDSILFEATYSLIRSNDSAVYGTWKTMSRPQSPYEQPREITGEIQAAIRR